MIAAPILSNISTNIHFAAVTPKDPWWLDESGSNWWNRKAFFSCNAIYLTKKGSFRLRIRETWYNIHPHQLVFIPADSDMEFAFDGNESLEKYYVHFDLSFSTIPLAKLFSIPAIYQIDDFTKEEAIFQQLIQAQSGNSIADQLMANALLLSLVSSLLDKHQISENQHPIHHDQMLHTAMEFMTVHAGHNITVSQVAAHVGYSLPYFSRKFKQAFGTSPSEYIMQLRLIRAQHLLRTTDLPVCAIASNLGFCDASYFSNFFKSKTGMLPGIYRSIEKSEHR